MGVEGERLGRRSQVREVWNRFKKRKISVIGLGIIAFLVLVTIFAVAGLVGRSRGPAAAGEPYVKE